MLLGTVTPGVVAKYVFSDPFDSLNGVYKLMRIMSFDDTLALGVDLVSLYESVGSTEEQYNIDYPTIYPHNVVSLMDVTLLTDIEATPLIIPEYFINGVPDTNVNEYSDLAFSVHLGIFKDTDKVAWLKNEMQQFVAALTGSTSDAIDYEIDTKWLTDIEYAAIEDARVSSVTSVTTSYAKYNKLLKDYQALLVKNQVLEEIVKSLASPPTP